MKQLWKRAVTGVAIAAVATCAVLAMQRLTSFDDLDWWTYDFTVDHVGLSGSSKQIVLIDFDEDTFQRIKQYPVPRSIIAQAITLAAAGKPRVIGLDVLLSEARSPAQDKAMQDALTAAGMVVLASETGSGQLRQTRPLPEFCQPEDATSDSGFCKEGTPGAMGYAVANVPLDSDGFLRQANLFFAGSPPVESFPLMLAQQYAGESVKPGSRKYLIFLGRKIWYADPDLKTMLIGAWGWEPATRIPAWKVLAGQVPAAAFADKLVLIGQTSEASGDKHFTPLFRVAAKDGARLRLGGTAVLAAAIRSLLEGRSVRPAPNVARTASDFAVALGAALLLFSLEVGVGFGCVLVLMVMAGGVSLLLYAKLRYWLPFLPMEMAMAITVPITLGTQFVAERLISREAHAQREQLMRLFSSYVDPAVAETIWKRRDELSLFGEERIATVMFTDIRGFTALSADKPPAHVLRWLNTYLAAMDEVIRAYGGFLNKFIGDGLMIIFGLPLSKGTPELDALRAVECAQAMLVRVEQLNLEQAGTDMPALRIGAGIHSGPLMAGSIGSPTRQEYSVIGATVNLASRLESLNKPFHTEILMSAATADMVRGAVVLVPMGPAKVAGLEEPVEIFTVRAGESGGAG
jgi:adenylate cyclase